MKGQLLPLIGVATLTQLHAREGKRPKVILQGEASNDRVMDADSILRRFDEYFVVDTNTREISGSRVSMSVVLHAKVRGDHVHCIPITAYEFWDSKINPELLGWFALVTSVEEAGLFADRTIGLIVDAHLGVLDEFNARKKELFNGVYLPERMSLIYASADKGIGVANKLIKLADQLATVQLESMLRTMDMSTLKDTPYPCRLFRQWLP